MKHHQSFDSRHLQSADLNHKIVTVLSVVLASFAFGSIPLIYGFNHASPDTAPIYGGEAALWEVVGK
jgi:hypothetical protein